jgi:hypothetical protein
LYSCIKSERAINDADIIVDSLGYQGYTELDASATSFLGNQISSAMSAISANDETHVDAVYLARIHDLLNVEATS